MTKNFAIAFPVLLVLLLSVFAARAETTAGSSSGSVASTQNTNAPVFNFPANPSDVRNRIDTNQAATAATVFVNPPSADVCALPGTGVSAQGATFGVAISNGGDPSETCETRADGIHLKVTGASAAVLKARQCQSPRMAQAFEDADEPCPERLRPKNKPTVIGGLSADPLIAARQMATGR